MKKIIIIVLALVFSASLFAQSINENTVSIKVDTSKELRTIDWRLFGAIQNQGRNGEGAADENGRPYEGFVEAVKTMGVTFLRYPGGSMGGAIFDWREAIGPIQDRKLTYARTSNPGQILYYGVDEMAQMAEACGIPLDICINNQMLNVEQALQYLAYLSMEANDKTITDKSDLQYWANLRASYGHKAPYSVLCVDIGNEENGGGGWRAGKFVSLSDKYQPAVELTEENTPEALYLFGGTTYFEKAKTITYEDLGATACKSDGQPNQQKRAPYVFIVDNGTCHVYVGDEEWTIVSDLSKCGAADRACTVNYETGYITFGNGTNGAIPEKDAEITISYQTEHEGFFDWQNAIHEHFPGVHVSAKISNEDVFALCGTKYEYDSFDEHPLSFGFPANSVADMTEFYYQELYGGSAQGPAMAQLRDIADSYAGKRTELQLQAYGHGQGILYNKQSDWHLNLVEGLLCAEELFGFINNDFHYAANFLLNDMPFDPDTTDAPTARRYNAMIINRLGQSDFTITSKGVAFSLISSQAGQTQVACEVSNSPTYTLTNYTHAYGLLKGYKEDQVGFGDEVYQQLKAIASVDDDGCLTIVVINGSIDSNLKGLVNLGSYKPASNTIQVSEYNGAEIISMNTCDKKEVSITDFNYQASGNVFVYEFPAHSITRMVFKASN
ncbi:MAG: hypothetical protein IJJ95_00270 [Spirochaetales bacterium]|nr:hypothetical protein [Spirochaetales bacterium]